MFRKWFPRYDPRSIIVAGWPASGSTFMYQVAMELGLNVQKKKHGKRGRDSADFTLFAFRDPRDVLCSHARRMNKEIWDRESPHAAITKSLERFLRKRYPEAIYESAAMQNVFLARYELFCQGNEGLFINFLADNFLVPLTDERRNNIIRKTSIDANIQRAQKFDTFSQHDEKTQIHGSHISNKGHSGAWRELFSPQTVGMVKQQLGSLIVDLGYERDLDWGVSSTS